MLKLVLHPASQGHEQAIETYTQVIQATSNQGNLLDSIIHILYNILDMDSLSVWRYQDKIGVLKLSHLRGLLATNDLLELPFDIFAEPLYDLQYVLTLPESALRQGLITLGIEVIIPLNISEKLIGIIGLGGTGFGKRNNSEQSYWLGLMAEQLALVVQNVYLTTDFEEARHNLQQAYRRINDTQEEERRNLAAELHDDILSRLTLMTLTLRNAHKHLPNPPNQGQSWVEMMEKDMQYIKQRLREITQGLHPSVLTDLGLIPALQAYLDSLAKQSQSDSSLCTITLTAQGFNHTRIAEPKLERDLYYITRQALDNALTHARAEQILIHLRWREDKITITVQDTGCGMKDSPEQLMGHNGHLGLLSMYERTVAWGGQITFHTGPDQGTTIHIHISINQFSDQPNHLQALTRYLAGPTSNQQPLEIEAPP